MSGLRDTSYLFGANAVFIEEMYKQYLADSSSVDKAWQDYFSQLKEEKKVVEPSLNGASWKPKSQAIIGVVTKEELLSQKLKAPANKDVANMHDLELAVKVANLINAFRTHGHTDVVLDPLGIVKPRYHSELDYRFHGIDEADLDRKVILTNNPLLKEASVRQVIEFYCAIYSGRVATEYMHIESHEERLWLQQKLEATAGIVYLDNEEKKKALIDSMRAETFESYLHTKFPGAKRFSIEGLENVIPSIEFLISESARHGVREVIIGMAHRGRLNTLTNVMGKPFHAIFSEFRGEFAFPEFMDIPGDVKYHLGYSSDRNFDGIDVHLSLNPNPSHLEVVNAVVLGKVRAKQDLMQDAQRSKVMGLLLHGDAAFAGQGTVMEALSLSQLGAYHTGGTIHIVTNNQIGFTTNPDDSRSTSYSTDIAKFIGAPIFHVNGDDAEAVVFVSKLASEYRARFKKDVVIDIVGYRKYGHNEGDEPLYTQPIMYQAIKNKKTPPQLFADKLLQEGVIDEKYYENIRSSFKQNLDKEFEKSLTYKPQKPDWLEGNWQAMRAAARERDEPNTGVEIETLKKIGAKLCEFPKDFSLNSKLAKQLEGKKEMIASGKGLDWSMGEALAFGTLLAEGSHIRMTGQDVERGTFSHRHAVFIDQVSQRNYIPLNNLGQNKQGLLEIKNSNLSEFGVLAFEYGYSFTDPKTLTIWEAQFGDFSNGAQVVIDQYISSAEAKWLRMSGIVLLLPHGYEGQGPEHSSARPERFLQLCAKDNMQVVNCTTPASIYHAFRRQLHRDFRKPLVVMSPKSLLRHKLAVSDLADFAKGTKFRPVIGEEKFTDKAAVKRVILCSGKVYYDIFEKRQELGLKDTAIIRLEQLYPFPAEQLEIELSKFPKAELIWCQEEHENMGYFYFVEPRLEKVLSKINHDCKRARYVGRERSASPAVGYMKLHQAEFARMMEDLFNK